MTDDTPADDVCRCPHCGGTSFSWSATIREHGTVRHSGGEVTVYDREELGEVTDINFHSLYCEECNSPVEQDGVVFPDKDDT